VLVVLWLVNVASNSSEQDLSSVEQTPAGQPPYTSSQVATSAIEQIPPTGQDRVLDAAQIRYCLSEDIRLEAARDVATTGAAVERFNSMIDDFNARCTGYRYRRQVFESVQRQVQANRTSLQAAGIARFHR
jgi:hypothetical protein